MKLKSIIYYIGVALAAVPSLTACSDFLEVEPLNEITLEKFWNEENDVYNVVTSCYSTLQSQGCMERMMAWGEFRSDNIVGGTNVQNNKHLSNIFKENINASNDYVRWEQIYNVINTCNIVLHYAPTVAAKDPNYTESELRATEAEVSALRDLCYFYLIRTFRDVPFTTQAYLDNDQHAAVEATPFHAVLDSLIGDLERVEPYAVKTYPTNKPYYQHGRITQDAIHAMLCDMYLWKQDYRQAVRYADLVIEAKLAEYKQRKDRNTGMFNEELQDGYPLISDMSSSFYGTAYGEIFGAGNSKESIFELMYMSDNTMLSNGAVSYYYGNTTTSPGIVKPADFISNDMTLDNPKVFVDKYDVRFYENLVKKGSEYGIGKYAVQSASVILSGDKINAAPGNMYPADFCKANWIFYRLTDVMLMKAEALVEQIVDSDTTETGKAQRDTLLHQAFNIVNTVAMRSNCATTKTQLDFNLYSSKTQMANLVQDERQRELMFEGKRWFDLVRRSLRDGNTKYLISRVMQKGSENSSVLQSKLTRMEAIFWPYHRDELQVNPMLRQNPAFGSGDTNSYKGVND